jgi:hypothetical protein
VIDLFGELTYDPLIKRLGEMVLMRPNACKSIAFCRIVGRDVTGTYAKCYPPVTQARKVGEEWVKKRTL